MRILIFLVAVFVAVPGARAADLLLPSDFFAVTARFNADMDAAFERARPGDFDPAKCQPSMLDPAGVQEIFGGAEDAADLWDPATTPAMAAEKIRAFLTGPTMLNFAKYRAAMAHFKNHLAVSAAALRGADLDAEATRLETLAADQRLLPAERERAADFAARFRQAKDFQTRPGELFLSGDLDDLTKKTLAATEAAMGAAEERLRRERESAAIISQVCTLQIRINAFRETLGELRKKLCKFIAITGDRKFMPTPFAASVGGGQPGDGEARDPFAAGDVEAGPFLPAEGTMPTEYELALGGPIGDWAPSDDLIALTGGGDLTPLADGLADFVWENPDATTAVRYQVHEVPGVLQSYASQANWEDHAYGNAATVETIGRAAQTWSAETGSPIYFNDLSQLDGADSALHAGHTDGSQVDLKWVSTDGAYHPGDFSANPSVYDREGTIQMISTIRSSLPPGYEMRVLFSDPGFMEYFAGQTTSDGTPFVQAADGHANHLDIRIFPRQG